MQFCQRHWDMMRAAIDARGLTPLVASSGPAAITNTLDELQHGLSADNFDPLMAMHWTIAGNLMRLLGQSSLYLLSTGEEDPIDADRLDTPALKEKYAGKTWPRCPVCYANIAHEFTCTSAVCTLSRENGYDICIEWSADRVKEQFDKLMKGTA